MRPATDERRLVAGLVTPTRRFHLDGVGALVGEQLGAKRSRRSVGQLQHFHLGEYAVHVEKGMREKG
jgi:hypothetical protein